MSQPVRLGSVILGVAVALLPGVAPSQPVGEAALRTALALSQTTACRDAATPINVVALPLVDTGKALSPAQTETIRSEFLSAFQGALPACARLTDAMAAFGTVSFMAELETSGRLSAEQRELVQDRLQNAHSLLAIRTSRRADSYHASVTLTEIADGQAISVGGFTVPDQLRALSCGLDAIAESVGLDELAQEILDSVHPIRGLTVSSARFQDSDQPYEYGAYISQQFLGALSKARSEDIFGAPFPIRFSDSPALGADEYAVGLRYWVCDDDASARLVVSVTDAEDQASVFTRTLSLAALPSGMTYKRAPDPEPDNTAAIPLSDNASMDDMFPGVVSVSPRHVTTGDLLAISAEPPENCNPFFFDLAPGGRLTPLPLHIFDITQILPGLLRYDNNADSKYGITVQADDERGPHRLGYICQPDELTNQEIRTVFQSLRTQLVAAGAGAIDAGDTRIRYATATYEVRP
jgi:hypothetical protein